MVRWMSILEGDAYENHWFEVVSLLSCSLKAQFIRASAITYRVKIWPPRSLIDPTNYNS